MRCIVFGAVNAAVVCLSGCASSPTASADRPQAVATADGSRMDAKSARAAVTPIAADRATLEVRGMSCPKCANNIDRQLRDLRGVESVAIDLGSGRVDLAFTDQNHPSAAELARAIDDTGFTLVAVSTP